MTDNSASRLQFGNAVEPALLPEFPPIPIHKIQAGKQAENPTSSPSFEIYLHQGLFKQIWRHVNSDYDPVTRTGNEVTGIVAGHPFQHPETSIPFLIGISIYELETPDRSLVHVHVDAATIKRYREIIQNEGLQPIIWYHSHPGHGIFLSADDAVVTGRVWDASWHVAMVLDPAQGRQDAFGLFRGPGHEIIPHFYEFTDVPRELAYMRLYNQALNLIKREQYDEAHRQFIDLDRDFQREHHLFEYWQHRSTYYDTQAHIDLLPTYQQALRLLRQGDDLQALETLRSIIAQRPEGYLNVNEHLRSLSFIRSHDDPISEPASITTIHHPDKTRSTPRRSPKQGAKPKRPIPRRKLLLVLVAVPVIGILVVIGMTLVSLFNQPNRLAEEISPAPPASLVQTMTIPNADLADVTDSALAVATESIRLPTSTQQTAATNTPQLTLTATIAGIPSAFQFTGRIEPSSELPLIEGKGTLIVIVKNETQQPLSGIRVSVRTTDDLYDNIRDRPSNETLTNDEGFYVEDAWSNPDPIEVLISLIETYQQAELVGDPVRLTFVPQRLYRVIFVVKPLTESE